MLAHHLIRHAVGIHDGRGFTLSDALEQRKWGLIEWMDKYGMLNHRLTDGVIAARCGNSSMIVYRVCHADSPTIVILPSEGYAEVLARLPIYEGDWAYPDRNGKLVGIDPERGGSEASYKIQYEEALNWLNSGAQNPLSYVAEAFFISEEKVRGDLKKRSG